MNSWSQVTGSEPVDSSVPALPSPLDSPPSVVVDPRGSDGPEEPPESLAVGSTGVVVEPEAPADPAFPLDGLGVVSVSSAPPELVDAGSPVPLEAASVSGSPQPLSPQTSSIAVASGAVGILNVPTTM
jgi:hypothetical protein